jgi:hypothetical protein
MVVASVAPHAAGSRRGPDQAELLRHVLGHGTRVLEARHHRRRIPEEFHRARGVPLGVFQALQEFADDRFVDVEADATGADHPASEAAATQRRRHVQEIAADPPAVRSGGQESDVARQCAQISDMVREALEF